MKLHKRFGLFVVLLCLAGTAFAQKLEATWIGETDSYGIAANINSQIDNINVFPKDLLQGFANASVFASHGATQRAFGDFKLFSITTGFSVGFSLYDSPSSVINDFDNMEKKLKTDGDLGIGASIPAVFQFGLNSSFLIDGLYLGLRIGYIPLDNIISSDDFNLDYKIFHIGPVAHYRLLKGFDIGVVKWRGITVGTGFLFQKTTLDLSIALENNYLQEPNLHFNMDVTTYTIPLEVNTSIQLLWFLNLDAGVGVDFAFGKNSTSISMDSGSDFQTGRLVVKGGGSESPTFLNPKIMFNMGFKFGPVIIDIPVNYYFLNSHGLSVGLTMGAVF